MSDWLHAAAEVGGAMLAICAVILAVMLLGFAIERWSR